MESKEVYNKEHIDGAVSLPMSELKTKFIQLPKDKKIIVYSHCCSATKAAAAAKELKNLNFKEVAYLSSYAEYKKLGMPVAVDLTDYKNKNTNQISHSARKKKQVSSVSAEIVYSRIRNHPENAGKHYVIIDVRRKREYKKGHIPLSVNIPVKKLSAKRLPKDKEIFICDSDGKTYEKILKKLKKLDYTPHFIESGFSGWQAQGYAVKTEEK